MIKSVLIINLFCLSVINAYKDVSSDTLSSWITSGTKFNFMDVRKANVPSEPAIIVDKLNTFLDSLKEAKLIVCLLIAFYSLLDTRKYFTIKIRL